MIKDNNKNVASPLNVALGKRIKYYRKKKGITQFKLGKAIGKTESSIAKYEKGLIGFSVDVVNDISQALKVDIDDLFKSDFCFPFDVNEEICKYTNSDILPSNFVELIKQKIPNLSEEILLDLELFAAHYNISGDMNIRAKKLANRDSLLNVFNKLNEIGQNKAIEYVTDLSEQDKYTKED